MSYTQIITRVTDQTVQMVNTPLLASGSEGVLQIKAQFDSLWDGYGKTAVFYRDPKEVYHITLVGDTATVPPEVIATEGYFYLGFLGSADNTRTTEVVRLEVVQGAIRVATADPAETSPDIYEQLLAAHGQLDKRFSEMIAMRSADGAANYALSDEYILGTIKSNGVNAYIDFTISKMSLVGGGYHYSDYCIIPALAPLGPVDLHSSNPDINVTLEPATEESEGWARLLIENVGNSMLTTDETVFVRAYYPLANVFISELADLRVGANGSTFETAGDAVRNQTKGVAKSLNGVAADEDGNIEYPVAKVIAPEQELTFTETNGVQTSTNLALTEPLKVGSTYRVVWGDKEIICKCYDKAEGGTLYLSNPMLGNASLFLPVFPNTGEPFYIVDNRTADNGTMLVIKSAEDTNTKVAIYILEKIATEEYVREYVRAAARIAEVNLLAANWVGTKSPYSQVVTIPGITNYSQVDLTPSVEQLAIFHDKDLAFVTENEEGVVTVYAIGDKPLNDYTMQVTIKEVIV